jgi:hypothetical protein
MRHRDNKHYLKRLVLDKNYNKLQQLTEYAEDNDIALTAPNQQPKNKLKLIALEDIRSYKADNNVTVSNLYDCLVRDSESYISHIDQDQKTNLNSLLRSRYNFVEKREVFLNQLKIKNTKEDKIILPTKKFSKINYFFDNVFKKSKEKSLKLKPINRTSSLLKIVGPSSNENGKCVTKRFSVINIKDVGRM